MSRFDRCRPADGRAGKLSRLYNSKRGRPLKGHCIIQIPFRRQCDARWYVLIIGIIVESEHDERNMMKNLRHLNVSLKGVSLHYIHT